MQASYSDGLFFRDQVEQVMTEMPLRRYTSIARSLFSVATDVSPWADAVSSTSRTSYSEAEIIGYKSVLPILNKFKMKKITHPVVALGGAAVFDIQEVAQAQATGTDLNRISFDAVIDGVYRGEDRLTFRGDSNSSVYGVTNHPLIAQNLLEANGSSNGFTNTTSWLGKTMQQIISELGELLRLQSVLSAMSSAPLVDTLLLPSTVSTYLATNIATGVTSGQTMLTILKQTFPQIQFASTPFMDSLPISSLGNASNTAALLYSFGSLEVVIPRDVTFEPVQAEDLKFSVPGHSRFGGLRVNYPESSLLLVGI